jgi:hypothetical protein
MRPCLPPTSCRAADPRPCVDTAGQFVFLIKGEPAGALRCSQCAQYADTYNHPPTRCTRARRTGCALHPPGVNPSESLIAQKPLPRAALCLRSRPGCCQMLERQMYGHAAFDLLRHRILHAEPGPPTVHHHSTGSGSGPIKRPLAPAGQVAYTRSQWILRYIRDTCYRESSSSLHTVADPCPGTVLATHHAINGECQVNG